MKTKKEIKTELDEIVKDIKYCGTKLSDFDEGIYRGWIEALCFVLDLDLCSCGYAPVEGEYLSCSDCLDEQDESNANMDGR